MVEATIVDTEVLVLSLELDRKFCWKSAYGKLQEYRGSRISPDLPRQDCAKEAHS
jgi:hypothetical protein